MDGWIVIPLMYNPGQFFFFLILSSITKKMDSGYDALFVCLGKNDTKCFSVFTIVSCRFSLSLDPKFILTTACLFVDVSTIRPLCDVSRLLHHRLLTHFFPKHRRTIAVPDTDPYGTWQICHKDVNITLGEIVGKIIAELPSGMKKVGLALLIGCHIRDVKKSLDVPRPLGGVANHRLRSLDIDSAFAQHVVRLQRGVDLCLIMMRKHLVIGCAGFGIYRMDVPLLDGGQNCSSTFSPSSKPFLGVYYAQASNHG